MVHTYITFTMDLQHVFPELCFLLEYHLLVGRLSYWTLITDQFLFIVGSRDMLSKLVFVRE